LLINQQGAYGFDKPTFEIDRNTIIPYEEGLAVELTGDVHTPGTQHYNVHYVLETFWHPYRTKDIDDPYYKQRPTNAQYLSALTAGLLAAKLCPDTVTKLIEIAGTEQIEEGLKPTDLVPVIPSRLGFNVGGDRSKGINAPIDPRTGKPFTF